MSVALQFSRARKVYNLVNALIFAGTACRSSLPISLLEIGARGGLQKRWTALHTLGWLRPIFVEADPAEAKEIESRYGRSSVLPVAAGDAARPATLYVTRSPGLTSVLPPDRNAIESYTTWGLPLEPTSYDIDRELPVDLVSLDDILAESQLKVDFVKTDVQGFDLNVLRGLERSLPTVSNVMCEVQFVPIYQEQSCFEEVLKWMMARGFKCIAIRPFGGHIFEANAHFENLTLKDERSIRLQVLWRKLFGVSSGEVNHSLSH